jgi:hypothetical protein
MKLPKGDAATCAEGGQGTALKAAEGRFAAGGLRRLLACVYGGPDRPEIRPSQFGASSARKSILRK